MKPSKGVGIAGYGVYIPRYRIPAEAVTRMWQGPAYTGRSGRAEKAVAGLDEDTITMAIEAARNALARSQVAAAQLGAIWLGTESKPYSVKPSATVVAAAVGASPEIDAADLEFACKAGTEAMQACIGMVGSDMVCYAMAIGADTAQGRPGDDLELTAGAGAVALIIGPQEQSIARLEASYSYATDTPDFFRREGNAYPMHGNRFTGDPAYFEHTTRAATGLLGQLERSPREYDYAVFHQPNVSFPLRVARQMGFSKDQVATGILAGEIGNTYSAAAMMGLAAVLDVAQPGQRILFVSYGSGAGSDAFSLVATDRIVAGREDHCGVRQYVSRRQAIDYAQYARFRRKLRVE